MSVHSHGRVHELCGRVHELRGQVPELQGRVHDLQASVHAAAVGVWRRRARDSRGQGTVEYVGLILLIAVLIAGVVSASRSFSDTGIAEAVIKKIKAAIDGVAQGK